MTLITWQNGGPVLRDGKVGTEAACCCGCQCSIFCNADITIKLVNDPTTINVCSNAEYQAFAAPSDPASNTHGGINALMYCEADPNSPNGIIWRVEVTSVFFTAANGDYCDKVYEGVVEADTNCLPVEGDVTLQLTATHDIQGNVCGQVDVPTMAVERADI